ncbi:UNVERIFIED_CONTAM: hypothetical protein PYX00_008545 [Menopon gallinae]|uniref:Gustatory receptor n=1 Tax=Menopon gallinae TaxID=328185 RepID=A0AAW2HNY7_9NEOP
MRSNTVPHCCTKSMLKMVTQKYKKRADTDLLVLRYYYRDYTKLLNVLDDLNECFGASNLISLSYSLISTVITFVVYLKNSRCDSDFQVTLDSFYILAFLQDKSIFCFLIAKLIKQEVENSSAILYELHAENNSSDVQEQVEILSIQFIHRNGEFNACGFYKIDFSFLLSMISSVITYIIIIIQFESAVTSIVEKYDLNQTILF